MMYVPLSCFLFLFLCRSLLSLLAAMLCLAHARRRGGVSGRQRQRVLAPFCCLASASKPLLSHLLYPRLSTLVLPRPSLPRPCRVPHGAASSNRRRRRRPRRLVRLHTRVETLHEVLEKLLNDDEDMRDLNLTAALLERQERAEREATRALLDQQAAAAAAAAFGSSPGGMTADYDGRSDRSSSSASSNSTSSSDAEAEVAEVEMLLEAYFMHIDNTYNRLQTLDEYIKDTEDFVQLELSQQRNRLITLDLVLTAWSTALAMPTMVGGIFGMNLTSQLEDEPSVFYQVRVGLQMLAKLGGRRVGPGRFSLLAVVCAPVSAQRVSGRALGKVTGDDPRPHKLTNLITYLTCLLLPGGHRVQRAVRRRVCCVRHLLLVQEAAGVLTDRLLGRRRRRRRLALADRPSSSCAG